MTVEVNMFSSYNPEINKSHEVESFLKSFLLAS